MKYEIQNPDLKTDDLLQDLAEETKEKAFNLQPEAAQEPAGLNPADFTQEDFTEPEFEPFEPVTEAPLLTLTDFTEQAHVYVNFLDGIQALFLPSLYRKKLFSPEEIETLPDILQTWEHQKRTTPQAAPPEIVSRYGHFEKYLESLPFSEKEEKLLIKPLAKVLQKYNHAPGVESALIMAAFTVMAPRIIPVLNFRF